MRGILKRLSNDFEHSVRVFQGLIVPEAKDTHTTVGEAPLSLLVIGGLLRHGVPTTVELDGEARFGTIEVEDESTNGVLASEFPPAQTVISQNDLSQ